MLAKTHQKYIADQYMIEQITLNVIDFEFYFTVLLLSVLNLLLLFTPTIKYVLGSYMYTRWNCFIAFVGQSAYLHYVCFINHFFKLLLKYSPQNNQCAEPMLPLCRLKVKVILEGQRHWWGYELLSVKVQVKFV